MKNVIISLYVLLHTCITLGQVYSDTVFFDTDSYRIDDNELDKIKDIPLTNIHLEGRADKHGRHDYNLALSKKRINSVKQLLINNGHQLDHISYDYWGDSKPIGNSRSPSWEQKNRCVIIFYELEKDSLLTTPLPKDYAAGKQKKYSFTNKEGLSVTLDNGVKVNIPENTFNALPNNTIDFSITSYMTKSDFILAGLHSMAGENLLESAGMFFLEATSNGKPLDKKLQKAIIIEVPNKTNKDDFELFYGHETSPHDATRNIDWVQAASEMQNQISTFESSVTNPSSSKERKNFIRSGFFTISETDYRYGINKQLDPDKKKRKWYKSKWFKIDRKEMSDAFTTQKTPVTFQLTLTLKDGLVKSPKLQTTSGSLTKVCTGKLIKVFRDANIRRKKEAIELTINFNYGGYPNKVTGTGTRSDTTGLITERVRVNYIDTTNLALNMITMRVSQLDWINCDRFYRVKETEPLFVDTDEDASVFLVFSKFNSIMKGWYKKEKGFSFGKIPVKKPYTILAYKSEGEDVLFAEGSSSSPSALMYRKITKEEFKALIAKY